MNHMTTITPIFKTTIINLKAATRIRVLRAIAIAVLALAATATTWAAGDSFTWTNTVGDVWQSTTAWQMNLFTAYTNVIVGTVTNGVTNSFCQTVSSLPPNSITVSNCDGGATGDFPQDQDSAIFTNDLNYTITFNADAGTLNTATFTQHVGTVTLNMGTHFLNVTNAFRVGRGDATSTVWVVGGTLSAANDFDTGQIRIGDGSNCVGTLVVTNSTVFADATTVGLSSNAVGTLIVSGTGVLRGNGVSPSTITCGTSASSGNQLLVVGGGKVFATGTITVGNAEASSNNFMLVSGPTSAGTVTGEGNLKVSGDGNHLIISNGAVVNLAGTLTFGTASSFSTGYVVGANSRLIVAGAAHIGFSSSGGTNNNFTVYDGGFMSCGGTFAWGNNAFHVNDGVNFGGVGAMSTGLFVVMRSASNVTNHYGNYLILSNSFVTCNYLAPQGPVETIGVMANATLKLTNSFIIASGNSGTNCVVVGGNVGSVGQTLFVINNGTLINLRTADNGGGISFGGVGFDTLLVTNGGRLFTSRGTIGAAGSQDKAIITGAGSVWSNFSGQVSDPNFTNLLIVGTGTGATNSLSVSDGAMLFNNGTLLIGNSLTAVVNSVSFGGAGLPATIVNLGSLNIGATATTAYNSVTITNASVVSSIINVGNSGALSNTLQINGGTISVGSMRIRPTNTITFTVGLLSAGALQYDSLANFTDSTHTNPLVVGDGTSAAIYQMTNTDTGYHNFNNGGLVITNGATLRGNGTLVGNVSVNGTFVPGYAGIVGSVFASNNMTFASTAALNYDLGTLSSDAVTVNGNLGLGGTLNIASSGSFGVSDYTIFSYVGALTGNGTLTVGTNPNGALVYAIDTNTLGSVILHVTSGIVDSWAAWETHYFPGGGPSAAGTFDADGDGVNNTNEFLSGFAPNNSAAYAHVIKIAKSGNDMVVTYLGANGDNTWSPGIISRTNVLEVSAGTATTGSYTNNFVSTGVTNILSGGNGLGAITVATDTGGATASTNRYYRIRVIAP
jgi:fibronectin-binding autotransporter adhesin